MRHATTSQMLGWTEEQCAEVDGRLDILARWGASNGKTAPVVDAVGREVDAWNRGRAYQEIWLKVTRSRLQIEIAIAAERACPGLVNEPGCGDVVAGLGQGSVLDLDGWWVDDFEKIDFTRPVEEALPFVLEAIRAEGLMYEAEARDDTGPQPPAP